MSVEEKRKREEKRKSVLTMVSTYTWTNMNQFGYRQVSFRFRRFAIPSKSVQSLLVLIKYFYHFTTNDEKKSIIYTTIF